MHKILHIITRLDMGGSAQNTLLTCHRLACKYEMVLVHGLSHESRMTDTENRAVADAMAVAQKDGAKFVAVSSLVRRIDPVRDLAALFFLLRIITKEKPSIVHTHSSKAGLLGRLAARLAGVPCIVHTPHGHVFYGHFGPAASRLFLGLEKLLARWTHRLVALTEGEKNDYLRLAVGRPETLCTIHSGVDVEKFSAVQVDQVAKRRALGLEQNGRVVGFIGWLLPIKGPAHLLRAMSDVWESHPDVHLVFIGKGDMEVDLRTAARKAGSNGRVRFLGWRKDVEQIMPVFDIFVLPSRNEGMGRVLVEAMAAGKPVVASRVGGIPDLIKHGENGLLVPAGDEKSLAAAIKQLIDDPEQAKAMGQRGRQCCTQFSVEAMVGKIDNLYQELVN